MYRESITRKLELLRDELAGPNPTAVERLLVDRIVSCWLQLHLVEMRFTQLKNLSIGLGEYWQDRIDRSQRRYLSAIKTLATVRKLALPVLQVNIAKRQTNIAAGTVPVVEKESPQTPPS